MALSFSAAKIIRSGGPYLHVQFSVIQDGTLTTATDLALPAGFPNLQSLKPTASGTGAGQPLSYTATGPITVPVYMNALGGTAAAGTTVTQLVPGTNNATQLTVTISAAGTAGNTINVVALVPDTF